MASSDKNNKKITRIIKLLEFIIMLDDKEIMKSSLESIIEMLKEVD